jgi:hypothetical protein
MWIFFGMGTNPKVYFLGGIGGRSLVLFWNKKVGLFQISKELFFGGVRWCVWKKQMGIIIIIFCDMMI